MKPLYGNKILSSLSKKKPGIEITTKGSCSVRCTRYCPWEQYQKSYGRPEELLTKDTLRRILGHIPSDAFVKFAGFCEPFDNPDCLSLIEYTIDQGFPVKLFTTLHGLKEKDVDRLVSLAFLDVCLHLPDCYGIVRHPGTPYYNDAVMKMVMHQKKVYFSVMNDLFRTNHREDFCRGKPSKRWLFPRMCDKWVHPTFIVMPNGDAYFCCMDFRLQYRVGNLLEDSYDALVRQAQIPFDLCRSCQEGVSVWKGFRLLCTREKKKYVF